MREMLAYLLSLSFLISASGYKGDSKNQDKQKLPLVLLAIAHLEEMIEEVILTHFLII